MVSCLSRSSPRADARRCGFIDSIRLKSEMTRNGCEFANYLAPAISSAKNYWETCSIEEQEGTLCRFVFLVHPWTWVPIGVALISERVRYGTPVFKKLYRNLVTSFTIQATSLLPNLK